MYQQLNRNDTENSASLVVAKPNYNQTSFVVLPQDVVQLYNDLNIAV